MAENGKVKTIEELAAIAAETRRAGRKVVLAHGVFDILHIGHKRHLEIGRRHGDLLIVTITTDKHVNKGPGRPVFPEKLRAEMLSAMDVVGYVGISPNPGAEYVIGMIKPDFYLKGSEYRAEENDVTGRIKTEKLEVERHGGEVVFTEDIVFSSSNLANRVMELYPSEVAAFLNQLRGSVSIAEIEKRIAALGGLRCLVIGDTILDEYVYVEPLGKPSKENIISTLYRDREIFCGGVIATANLTAQFCGKIDLVTVLGESESNEALVRTALNPNINLVPFYRPGGRTTIKSRMVDPGYVRKLIEIAYLDDTPLPAERQADLNGWVEKRIGDYDVVIVNDFGHGMIDEELIDILCRKARFLAINVQTNSANRGFNLVTKYPRADFVCIDEPEARLAVSDRYSSIESVVRDKLEKRMDCKNFVVTHGKRGSVVASVGQEIKRIPALVGEAIDTIGAGDAFFALAAPLVASGCDPFIAGFLGNAAGAMKVRIVGHRHQITRAEIVKYVTTLMK